MSEESLPQLTKAPIPVQTHTLRVDERLAKGKAQATGAEALVVGCPFCMVMLNDAKKDANSEITMLPGDKDGFSG